MTLFLNNDKTGITNGCNKDSYRWHTRSNEGLLDFVNTIINILMGTLKYIFKAVRKFYRFLLAIIDGIYTRFLFCIFGVKYGSISVVGRPTIVVEGSYGRITIGDNFTMVSRNKISHIGYNTPCVLSAENASIRIGNNVGMSMASLCALDADIEIGDNVLLGAGSKVYSSDFHSVDFRKRRNPEIDSANRKSAPVKIGDDCFIGAGVLITKGVTIGNRCVIGAESVVTKNIPDNCLVCGNPARIIRMLN